MTRLPRLLALSGVALALVGTTYAADQLTGRDRAPANAVVTISSTAPLFSADGLVGGEEMERCTTLRNEGPQPADVTLFGTSSQNDLSPWLEFELVRGQLPAGTAPGACTGFQPDTADYGSGDDGVVFRGTLATLPDGQSGIADPSRWAVGEEHAYLLRVVYTGTNPQQGLTTVQDFNWGATPFDDRGPEGFADPGSPGAANTTPLGGSSSTDPIGKTRQCTVVGFDPGRPYVGARATIKARPVSGSKRKAKAKKAQLAELGLNARDVVAEGEDLAGLSRKELAHRAALITATRSTAARRTPVMVVRISPSKNNTLSLRVALRKNGRTSSPKRWQWVRMRLNATATKSTVRWPFVSTAKTAQLRTGYNQIDLTLNRGKRAERIKGLPRLVRRSFAFVVKSSDGSTDCLLG